MKTKDKAHTEDCPRNKRPVHTPRGDGEMATRLTQTRLTDVLASCRSSALSKAPRTPAGHFTARSHMTAGGDEENYFRVDIREHEGEPAGILLEVGDAFRLHRALSNWLFHMVLGKNIEQGRVRS